MEYEMLLYLSFDQRHWNAHFKTISIIVFFLWYYRRVYRTTTDDSSFECTVKLYPFSVLQIIFLFFTRKWSAKGTYPVLRD